MIMSKELSPIDPVFGKAFPYPLYIVDRDFVVHQANSSAMKLAAKLGLGNVLPGKVRSQVDHAIVRNQEMVGDDTRRALHLCGDQTYLPQIFRLAGIFGGQDGWAVLLVDVTLWSENVEAKAKILNALTHEVKTPLTSIRMALHLLLEEKLGALNPDQRELLEVGRDECELMLAALQAKLELARLESVTKIAARSSRIG